MDLSTRYLGFDLPHPFLPGSSPLADDLGDVRRLEDAGAAAIVLRSLFVEQVAREKGSAGLHLDAHGPSMAEALAHFPPSWRFAMAPGEYLEQVRRVKAAVRVPVFASFNVAGPGPWLDHAARLQDAGADGLELNVYRVAADPDVTGGEVEQDVVDAVRAVRAVVRIPIAVKLLPMFTSLPNFARRLKEAGADGLVLFNRFLQPDLDPVTRTLQPAPQLSRPSDLLLRLRWIAVLHGRVPVSLAASGGVIDGVDAVKAVMAGADVVQMVSALLARHPEHLRAVRAQMAQFLEENGHASLAAVKGCMSLRGAPDASAHERAYYMSALQSRSTRA
jgi:dihydroorotate dehydrogenase (fumarate)